MQLANGKIGPISKKTNYGYLFVLATFVLAFHKFERQNPFVALFSSESSLPFNTFSRLIAHCYSASLPVCLSPHPTAKVIWWFPTMGVPQNRLFIEGKIRI